MKMDINIQHRCYAIKRRKIMLKRKLKKITKADCDVKQMKSRDEKQFVH